MNMNSENILTHDTLAKACLTLRAVLSMWIRRITGSFEDCNQNEKQELM